MSRSPPTKKMKNWAGRAVLILLCLRKIAHLLRLLRSRSISTRYTVYSVQYFEVAA
ncbi:hypothetical protein PR003_g1789 [Phytophthora rubi]|uniref:Uncharacterized protein n=1 Tax=Phytophthora rubi TaxID=129364 RepID=A0A6A3NKQ4_9STRA|nr:hypothetical protein PR002_g1848 [Phytophthora rubi]KAE9051130.1 hypothetical protein PR001_g1737 [Phytophthora rubi]KAE9357435.1 hypothetical protein PR003_g1789 [Phytophthora rubi]